MFSFFFYKQIFISMKNIIVFPYISFNMLYYVSWFLFSYQGGTKYLYIVRPLWRAYAIMIKTTKWIITVIKNLFFFVRVFFFITILLKSFRRQKIQCVKVVAACQRMRLSYLLIFSLTKLIMRTAIDWSVGYYSCKFTLGLQYFFLMKIKGVNIVYIFNNFKCWFYLNTVFKIIHSDISKYTLEI